MEVRVCQNPQSFCKLYADILSQNEAELQLFYANLQGAAAQNRFCGGVYDREKPVLLFLDASPYDLLIHEIGRAGDAAKLLAGYVAQTGMPIVGVQGNDRVCELFAAEYRSLTGKFMFLMHDMSVLVNTSPKRPRIDGALYAATEHDAATVAQFYAAFKKETMSVDPKGRTPEAAVGQLLKDDCLFIYTSGGKVVGFCATAKRGNRGTAISSVYIAEPFRGRGYAKQMVCLLTERLLETNEYVTLFVEKTNAAANKVYADVGFLPIASSRDYRVL